MNNSIPQSEKLDEDIKFLNTLIPNTEDYFSIIYALENLSQKSNFIILNNFIIALGMSLVATFVETKFHHIDDNLSIPIFSI